MARWYTPPPRERNIEQVFSRRKECAKVIRLPSGHDAGYPSGPGSFVRH